MKKHQQNKKKKQKDIEIWVDKETGFNYIYKQSGYCVGKPVMTKE